MCNLNSTLWLLILTAISHLFAVHCAIAEVELDPIAPRLANASQLRGEKIFLQCKACHIARKGGRYTIGPNLWEIVDRPVASRPDFPYSDSLKSIGGRWEFETLSRYLFDPKAMAPDTRMVFAGVKQVQDRADLIAYLNSLSEQAADFPPSTIETHAPQYGGLPSGEGREAVYFTCRACHALDQFTDHQLSRTAWDGLITEMVSDNGMAEPEPWARTLMVGYLASYFGEKTEQDWQGLPPGPGREEVFYTCNTCHSLMLVSQQGMSRKRWDETLEWMVEEQGMTEIEDAAMRDKILDYLSTHFGSG